MFTHVFGVASFPGHEPIDSPFKLLNMFGVNWKRCLFISIHFIDAF